MFSNIFIFFSVIENQTENKQKNTMSRKGEGDSIQLI